VGEAFPGLVYSTWKVMGTLQAAAVVPVDYGTLGLNLKRRRSAPISLSAAGGMPLLS